MAKKTVKRDYFDLSSHEWKVSHVRKSEYGTTFTLELGGLSLYNLKSVPAGKTYEAFIGMPQTKGKDGNYYNQYGLYLSSEDTEEVLEAVEEALEEEEKAGKKKKAKKKADEDEDEDHRQGFIEDEDIPF